MQDIPDIGNMSVDPLIGVPFLSISNGSVKTPAVKPCSVYIIDLLCSVGSKELSA